MRQQATIVTRNPVESDRSSIFSSETLAAESNMRSRSKKRGKYGFNVAIPSDEGERIVGTSEMSERWEETVKSASEDFEGWMRLLVVVGGGH
ncbi:hypothetical protein L195_g055673 [Trifolium pratense]|uniref:Uncharacterized protein n=2 Tax=Trifolium pratense TaxID=57577 RepID=A0A2K3KMM1_TRIPR|nr:hypothetical protein L195_g055673 [Trifolium pratense]